MKQPSKKLILQENASGIAMGINSLTRQILEKKATESSAIQFDRTCDHDEQDLTD